MNEKETRSLAEGTNYIQKAQIKCPKCYSLFLIPEPQIPRDVRCGKCKFTFQVGAEKISVIYSNDTKDILAKETVAVNKPNKTQPETVDLGNKTFEINSTQMLNETLHMVESQSLRSFLKNKGLTPKAYLSQSTTIESENDDTSKYIYGKEIGRGGMGAIISTHDVDTRRNIVTKILLRTASKKALLRFIEEAQITAQLEHPNIVPIYEIGVNKEGNIFYTMQHVKGDSLQKIIEKTENQAEFPLSRFLQILVDVSNAVAFAHSKKVIHRDLKPDNIMLGEYGEVILMDFGLAKILTNDDPDDVEELIEAVTSTRTEYNEMLTLEGDIAGTPKYMAPEQANGDIKGQDEQTDIYALGAILFACIAKKAPIPGSSVHEVLQNVIEGRKRPLPESTPPELVAIINKAMAVDKINRYKTVKDFSNDLKLYLQGYSISAKEDNFKEQCVKLIKRNKQAFLISSIALLIILVFGILAIQQIIQKKEEAENNLSKFLSAQKIAEQEKIGKEKLQKEKVKSWKSFYDEKFDLNYHLIPDRPIDYGFGNWGVHKGRLKNESYENWKDISVFENKVWLDNKEIHFAAQRGGYLYLNKDIFGNIRLKTSVTFISGNLPEITVFLSGSKENQEIDGYTIAIGTSLKFQKKGKTILDQNLPHPIIANEKQNLLFERTGNVFKFFLNDMKQPIFEWEDSEPIYGEKNSICGLYLWDGEISINSFQVTKQTWAKQNSPSDFIERLRKIGQDKLAIEEYKEIIFSTDDPLEKAEALFEMGTTFKNLNMITEAIAIFTSFTEAKNLNKYEVKIPFDQAECLIKKSYAFLLLISLDENYEKLNSSLDNWPLPLDKCYKDAIINCKNDESMEIIFNYVVTKIIRRNFIKNDHIKAVNFLKSLITHMNKDSSAICNKTLSEVFFNFSINYNSPKDYMFADYLLSEAITIDHDNDKYLAQRGFVRTVFYQEEEMVQQGLKDLYKAIEINQSNMYAYISLTNYFWKKEQHNQAIELLQNAIKKQPTSFELHNRLAGYYSNVEKTGLMENEISTMSKLSPNHPKTNYLMGISLLNNKKYKDLENFLAKKNTINFYENDYLYLKGMSFYFQEKFKETIVILEELTKNDHMEPVLHYLANAYYETADYQKTIDTLLRINKTIPLKEDELKLMKSSNEKLNHK